MLLTDDIGAVTDRYAGTPYGEEVRHQGGADNPFTFLGAHGVMQEGTTGLYHMGQRYYCSPCRIGATQSNHGRSLLSIS